MNDRFAFMQSHAADCFRGLDLLDRLFAESERSSSMAAEAWRPAIDAVETEQEFTLRMEVPGMDGNDLDITVTDGLLTIRGEKRPEPVAEKALYLRRELGWGAFRRTLRIPETVDVTGIDASCKDGLLTVCLPKRPEEPFQRVEIQTGAQEMQSQQF